MYYIYPIWGCSIQTDIQPSSSSSHILTWYHNRRFDLHRSPPSPSSAALPLGGANSTPRGSNLSTKPIFFSLVVESHQQQQASRRPFTSACLAAGALLRSSTFRSRWASIRHPRAQIERRRASIWHLQVQIERHQWRRQI